MTIDELEQEISAVPRFGAGGGLSNLKKYLDILGHPENSLRVVHVAGTNGKGSVCAFLESILRTAGYRTALFTSPHLIHMNERFRVNFQMCSDEELIAAWGQVKALLPGGTAGRNAVEDGRTACAKRENVPDNDAGREPLTYFEILFLMSLLIFSEKDVDYCIMETGLGGRLDATVLTRPVLSVITSISLDHTAILGDTIEAIAAEKAGIIKNNVPVIALDEDNGAFSVIRKEAERKNSHIYRVRSERITFLKKTENTIDFSINSSYYKDSSLRIMDTADYQIYNAALAVIAARVLLPDLPDAVIREGLLAMRWEGRMEEVAPGVYVDGAHNPGAITQLCRTVQRRGGRWSLLFAVCEDKDYSSMIRTLGRLPWQRIYITEMEGARGAGAEEIRRCFSQVTDVPCVTFQEAEEAFDVALREREEGERLLCVGSLYLVGEIKRRRQG